MGHERGKGMRRCFGAQRQDIVFEVVGEEVVGQGEPILLLHGFTESHRFWRDSGVVASLAASGRQVIAMDQRGHGGSVRPHEPSAYAVEHRTDDIAALLDHLGIEEADLWGYAMGGRTALETACRHPARIRSVIAGGATPYRQSLELYRRCLAGGIEAWIGLVERMAGPLAPATAERLRANDLGALRAAVARDRDDIAGRLSATGIPLLLYAGADDPLADAIAAYAELRGCTFHRLDGLNHIEAMFATDEVIPALLGFLERVAERRADGLLPPPEGRAHDNGASL